MLAAGIFYGLIASVGQSVSFVYSRRFIVNGHGDEVRLLALGHVMMGSVAAISLPLAWDWSIREIDAVLWYGTLTAATYLIGQIGFFAALRRSEVSRISPLLGLKVAAVAPFSMWLLSAEIVPLQWVAIAMSVFGGFLLNRIGGRLPLKTLSCTLFAVVMFALSDIAIIKLVDTCGQGFMASIRAVCVTYTLCGLVSLAVLPWCGSRKIADWKAAAPYAAIWLPCMFGLFASLAMCGAVLGNIVLSTRGLFSIGFGVLLARSGHHHLEQHVARSVLLRRAIAAVFMIAAIGLYAWAAN